MAKIGIRFFPANKDRLNGLQECYNRLRWHPEREADKEPGRTTQWADNRPGVQIFDTCKHFIRTIPVLVPDDSKPEDVDTDMEDHVYDEWRYMMMFAKGFRAWRPQEIRKRFRQIHRRN